jgi:ubiquinone/menaquinone biosynthesis C-methylase UbiE
MDQRLTHEIEHGQFLAREGAGEIWNWESPAGKARWNRRVKMLTQHITPNMKVLELGCGTGYFTREMVHSGAEITAIDISPDLLAIAKANISASNVIFKEENAYNMSFQPAIFDTIVGSSVLHHLDIEKSMAEIYRVLKSGGTMVFTEPNMMNPQIALQKNIPWIKRKLGDSPDETAFFRWQLKKILSRTGFKNIEITPFDFLHPAIPAKMVHSIATLGNFFEKIPLMKEIAGSLYIKATKN